MTQEIQQRINQILKGQVPIGYEKTKVGIVPCDWEETLFSTIFNEYSEFTSNSDELPLYSLTIENGIVEKSERYERSHLVKKENSYKILPHNYFAYNPMNIRFGAVARNKTCADVSVSGYYDIFTTKLETDLEFFDNFMTSYNMLCYYNKVSTGSLKEKQRVHFSQFINFNLPLPNTNERNKIAEILTTQEKLIELKEKLIAEKEMQKKYLMQNLLTGKVRLSGFSGKWDSKYLGELFSERIEKEQDGLQLLAITSSKGIIPRNELDLKDNSSDDKSKYLKISVGDIGYNTMRMWQGVSAYSNYEGIVSPAYTILKQCYDVNVLYFSYLFKIPSIIFKFYRYSQGLVDDTRNLKYSNFKKIKVEFPPLNEQNAIVEILTTSDKEIDLLKQDLSHEKEKKKALMQLLLTGIVRV